MSLRWGVAGTGTIATALVGDLPLTDGVLHAVGSRSIDRARDFAQAHGAARAHGSYADLLDDDEVDAVYIATPHRQHHELALAAIAAGKHLLVEKAFTCTVAGAREVVDAARSAGVFCMEAMWTRFQPAIRTMVELIEDGEIGEIRTVRADLGVVKPVDPTHRLWDKAQGGGALLDLGVYPVSFAHLLLGRPTSVEVVGSVGETGVDVEATLLMSAGDDRAALAQCSLVGALPGSAAVVGTDGWIDVEPRFHHPDRIHVHRLQPDGRPGPGRTIEAPPSGGGYSHELDEVHRCVAAGLTESPTMTLDATLEVMQVLETALHALGLHHDEATGVVESAAT